MERSSGQVQKIENSRSELVFFEEYPEVMSDEFLMDVAAVLSHTGVICDSDFLTDS